MLNAKSLTAPTTATVNSITNLGTGQETATTQIKQGSSSTTLTGPALMQNDILGITSSWLSDFLKGPQNNPNTTIKIMV